MNKRQRAELRAAHSCPHLMFVYMHLPTNLPSVNQFCIRCVLWLFLNIKKSIIWSDIKYPETLLYQCNWNLNETDHEFMLFVYFSWSNHYLCTMLIRALKLNRRKKRTPLGHIVKLTEHILVSWWSILVVSTLFLCPRYK